VVGFKQQHIHLHYTLPKCDILITSATRLTVVLFAVSLIADKRVKEFMKWVSKEGHKERKQVRYNTDQTCPKFEQVTFDLP
jgi:hypothetical protein